LAYGLGSVKQGPCGMGAESNKDLGIYRLDLPLKVGQTAYYLVGSRIAIVRRAALQDIAYKDIAAIQSHSRDYFIQ